MGGHKARPYPDIVQATMIPATGYWLLATDTYTTKLPFSVLITLKMSASSPVTASIYT